MTSTIGTPTHPPAFHEPYPEGRGLSRRSGHRLQNAVAPLIIALWGLAFTSPVFAVVQSTPVTGEIERVIVNDPADPWSGGIIVVAGINVIIPRNYVIDLPANRLTLQQFFTNAPPECLAKGETGLAKADTCNTFGTGGSATILANRTTAGDVIAGDVFIDKALENVVGVVNFVNYNDGYFRVGGITGDDTTGIMVRIDDPEGRFTVQQGLGCRTGPDATPNCSADVRYGVDPDNFTITAITGYPICIPSTVSRTFVDVLGLGTTTAQAAANGTGDVLCPDSNRAGGGVGGLVADSRRFAPIMVGDHVSAEGNLEDIGGARFLSAHTVSVHVALTTANDPNQPDYIIFDEVEWDVAGFQNARIRTLFIGFATLAAADPGTGLPLNSVELFALPMDPATNTEQEVVIGSTLGCDTAAAAGTCTAQGIPPTSFGIFKIRHDVDFIEASLGTLPGARLSPCQHLNAANLAAIGLTSPCSATPTISEEFAVLSPISRDIIGRTRHKAALNPGVVTLDINGRETQNGEYLNPTGIGHPEFVEINLAAIDTPFIFAGEPWTLDRRLGPGGCVDTDGDDIVDCEPIGTVPVGDPSMQLDPYPYSELDPGTQAGANSNPLGTGAGVPSVPPHTTQRGRILEHFPFGGVVDELPWPPVNLTAVGITPTQHAFLQCSALTGLDADSDGVDDALDNCTNVSNGPDTPAIALSEIQRDTDGDGFGNICDTDLNNDNVTNNLDVGILQTQFLTAGPDADFNGDNIVNNLDVGILQGFFLLPPGPSCCGITFP